MKKIYLLIVATITAVTVNAQYCLPTYNSQCTSGDYIDNMTFNTISNLATGCGSPSANNYTDYRPTLNTFVVQGNTYPITVKPGPWGQYFVAFIDNNQDLDYADPGEFFNIGYAGANVTITNNITIPLTALSGQTTLRVMCRYASTPLTQASVCQNGLSFGEVEEYRLNVGSPPQYDGSVTGITAPTTGCSLSATSTVTVNVKNSGTDTIFGMNICYIVNSGVPTCEAWTGTLLPGATMPYSFTTTTDLSVAGTYVFDAYTVVPADSAAYNDTLFGYTIQSIPTITSLPYSEDFESSDGGWVPSGTQNNWEWGTPSESYITGPPPCSQNVWSTGLTTNYSNNALNYLTSPCFDFSSVTTVPIIRFDHIFQLETGWDETWLERSINGGLTWTKVGTFGTGLNWYDDAANQWWDASNSGGWRNALNRMAGTQTQSAVRLRFVFSSDGSVTYNGVALDNIYIDTDVINAQPTLVYLPAASCGLSATDSVGVQITNMGSDTIFSLDACYIINGGTPVCETINQVIPFGASIVYYFNTPADFSAIDDYTVQVYTQLTGDISPCSDTAVGTTSNKPFVNTYPYFENFESGPGGWTSGGTLSTWAFGTPAKNTIVGAASGVNAWVTGGLGTLTYSGGEQSYVVGPCFDFTTLPADPYVAIKIWWDTETQWDGAVLQMSKDLGASWVTIGAVGDPINWYNNGSIIANPGGQNDGWNGTFGSGSDMWLQAQHPIDTTGFSNQTNVWMRIAFGADGIINYDGFAFDDFAIGQLPQINLPDTVGCANIFVNSGHTTGTFEWYAQDTSETFSSLIGNAPTITLLNPAYTDSAFNLILNLTDTMGFYNSDTSSITLFPAPFTNLGVDTAICYDDELMLQSDTSVRYSYAWNNGSVTDTITVTYPGGLIAVTVLDNITQCQHSDTINVFIKAPVDLPDSTDICSGGSASLDAGSGYNTYTWSTTAATQTITVSATGTYIVTVTDTIGCVSTDSSIVMVNAAPLIDLGPDTIICSTQTLLLDPGSGYAGYLWSNLTTIQTLTVNGPSLGVGSYTYTVKVTNAAGCEDRDTITVKVEDCSGIEEFTDDNGLLAVPNPNNGRFSIMFNSEMQDVIFELYASDGKLVYTESVNGAVVSKEFNVTGLQRGIYFMKVNAANKLMSMKIVIQ